MQAGARLLFFDTSPRALAISTAWTVEQRLVSPKRRRDGARGRHEHPGCLATYIPLAAKGSNEGTNPRNRGSRFARTSITRLLHGLLKYNLITVITKNIRWL